MPLIKHSTGNLLGLPKSSNSEWRINKINLSFKGEIASLEKEFREDYFKRSLEPFRFSLVLALVFYGLFAFLDALMFPQIKEIFWFIRFGVISPCIIAVLVFSYSSRFKKYMQPTITAIMYLTGLGIIVMIVYAARLANHYSYYAGLILIFIFGYTFIKARFVSATISGWSIVASYEIAAIWISDTPIEVLINNNYFFISANIIGMFISYFMELSSRRDFYMRHLLNQEQDKVKAANNALEKRVQERTRQLTQTNNDLQKEIEIRKHHQLEKTKLEAQLLHLQKMETIGTLAGGIAHDFNNILTPIMGYTEMALEELDDESTLRYDIEQINSAATRGKDLVQQILTFSKAVDYEKKPLQLHLVVTEVLNLIKASIPSNIEISYKPDTECGTIMADSTQMHQIIMNLCTNAYHAMSGKGGILEVSLDVIDTSQQAIKTITKIKKGKYIRLVVSDTGHGMDAETMARIFEPFFTKKEVGAGSGLGLSVVHGIVNSYNGGIQVESSPDEGTVFSVYLPQHSTGKPGRINNHKKTLKGKEHILFVDDEEEITYMGKRMLESLGYVVDIRSDSQSALEEITKYPSRFDLMVTDQTMPKMLGTELARRAKEFCPELKIIMITGYNNSIPVEDIKKNGITEIVIKPLILSEFSKLIRKVLDQKELIKA